MKINELVKHYLNNPVDSYIVDLQHMLRFNLSSNSDGPSPKIFNILKNLTKNDFRNYPTTNNLTLKNFYAYFLKLKKEQIVVYSGSNAIIEDISRIFLNKDDSVLIPIPNFFRFEDASLRIGAKIFHVDTWLSNSKTIGKKIIESIQIVNPKIIWLSNPNSSTGELIPKNIIKNILSSSKNSILVVDEAFMEYTDESNSCVDLINSYSNLIVLRTFSKFYGLASLRIGICITNSKITKILEQFKLKFLIAAFSEKIAISVLKDRKYVKYLKKKNEMNRNKLFDLFNKLGLEYRPSVTNTILVRHKELDLYDELLKENILVADFRNSRGIENRKFVRITIGNEQENKILFSVLSKIITQNNNKT